MSIFKRLFKKTKKLPTWKCMTVLTDGESRWHPHFYTVSADTRETAAKAFSDMNKHPQEVIERIELESDFDKISNKELGVVTHDEMVGSLISSCGF